MTAIGDASSVFVVDDNPQTLRSIERLLESLGFLVETFSMPVSFLDACRQRAPACALLDIKMPDVNGLVLQQMLMDVAPEVPVVILTGHGDVSTAVQAMKAGAVDFIEKPFDQGKLLSAIQGAMEQARDGERGARAQRDSEQRLAILTPREQEVLEQLLQGATAKQTARLLGVSPRTVESHRANIMAKMGVNSSMKLLRLFSHNL